MTEHSLFGIMQLHLLVLEHCAWYRFVKQALFEDKLQAFARLGNDEKKAHNLIEEKSVSLFFW